MTGWLLERESSAIKTYIGSNEINQNVWKLMLARSSYHKDSTHVCASFGKQNSADWKPV